MKSTRLPPNAVIPKKVFYTVIDSFLTFSDSPWTAGEGQREGGSRDPEGGNTPSCERLQSAITGPSTGLGAVTLPVQNAARVDVQAAEVPEHPPLY